MKTPAFCGAKKFYHVTADVSKAPDVSVIIDTELPKPIENNDASRPTHITYGMIINNKKENGSFAIKDRLYKLWREDEGACRKAIGIINIFTKQIIVVYSYYIGE